MMHFGPTFNTCPDRRRGDTKSNAHAIEGFQHMQRQHPGSYCARCAGETPRSDSDRYAELRKLVEAWQSHTVGSSQALADWRHQ